MLRVTVFCVAALLACSPEALHEGPRRPCSGKCDDVVEDEPLSRVDLLLACDGVFSTPSQQVDSALSSRGLSWSDLRMSAEWSGDLTHSARWLSDGGGSQPSVRVHPERVPELGACVKGHLEGASRGQDPAPALALLTALIDPDQPYLDLIMPVFNLPEAQRPTLRQALQDLKEAENPLPGAPVVGAWTVSDSQALMQLEQVLAPDEIAALTDLVVVLRRSHELRLSALGENPEDLVPVLEAVLEERYDTFQNFFVSPAAQGSHAIKAAFASIDRALLSGAAQLLTRAATSAGARLRGDVSRPKRRISFSTPIGRIVIDSTADSAYGIDELEDVALLVDLQGNDSYRGRYASATHLWMGAALVLDVSGDDRYGPDQPDVDAAGATAQSVLDSAHGFTQGVGVLGCGILVDFSGKDEYRASVFSQGASVLGHGLLIDRTGDDEYHLGGFGQGAGYFGVGLLVDEGGDDAYGAAFMGMGLGKPGGAGALVDGDGDDVYSCFHAEHGPELPGPSAANLFALTVDWAYNDGEKAHYMSLCQGTGWGYRGGWQGAEGHWMGGFGALLDFGDGDDQHVADTFSMGMGFVYGMGMFFDEGGDDRYRTFWWGPGAAAHMGVGLFWDEAGNDDLHVTRASGGWGFDYGVAWVLDRGGDDRYGGHLAYGESYTTGLSFFLNEGGADIYNLGGVRADPPFGVVHAPRIDLRQAGVFLDLGGGLDVYETSAELIGNDRTWSTPPIGTGADASRHHGIGVDE